MPIRFAAILVSLLTILISPNALAEPYDAGHARVELVSERAAAIPGETIYLALHQELDKDWHVYWRNPGDAGLPPLIVWQSGLAGERTAGGDFEWPLPHELAVVEGEIMDYGYDGALTLPFAVTVPDDASGPIRFEGTADYLICKDICIPETAPISYTLQVEAEQVPDRRGARLIASALETVPAALTGDASFSTKGDTITLSLAVPELASARKVRFFPYGNEIVHSAGQALSSGPQGVALSLKAQTREPAGERLDGVIAVERADGSRTGFSLSASQGPAIAGTSGQTRPQGSGAGIDVAGSTPGFAALIGLALLGGLILNLMPCVLPVLSIKANGLLHAAQSGDKAKFRAHGLFYTVGVLAAFAALAIAFIALRSVGEFWSLGALLQYPVVVAALALAAFVLGLWLLGFIDLGTSLQNVGQKSAAAAGNTGAFATGALAATAGAPCVGPFVAAPLGATLNSPDWQVMLVYLALGFGMALPFLMLSFAPGLARHLPKPGPWMERVKQFFAFPMFLTFAGLLVVLADQSGTGAAGWLVAGAALIGFGVWTLKSAGGSIRQVATVLGIAALLGGTVLPLRAAMAGTAPTSAATPYPEKYATEAWSPNRVDALLAEGKGVFVDFTATWCMICQANKRTTLTRPEVRDALDKAGIVFLVADFTGKDEIIARELEKRGRPGVPMYLLWGTGDSEPRILPQTLTPSLMLREIEAVG